MAVRDMSIIHKNEETLSSGSFLKMPLALALMFGGAAYAVDTFTESPHTFTEESVEYTTDLRIGDSGKTMYVTNNTTAITVGNSKNFAVGAEANGNGSFVQNGGSLNVSSGRIFVGRNSVGTGYFELNGGSVYSSGIAYFGSKGGVFTGKMTGGDISVDQFFMAEKDNGADGAKATFTQSGGSLVSRSWFVVGRTDEGTFTLDGGVVTNQSNRMVIGCFSPSKSKMTVNNGEVYSAGGITIAEQSGSEGTLEINGGTVYSREDALVGRNGKGALTIGGTGVFECQTANNGARWLKLGVGGSSDNAINLGEGGELKIWHIEHYNASTGSNVINFNGGTMTSLGNNGGTCRCLIGNYESGNTTAPTVRILEKGGIINTAQFVANIERATLESGVEEGQTDGGLTITGNGILNLNAVAAYNGLTYVESGVLALTNGYSFAGPVKVGRNGAITVDITAAINAKTAAEIDLAVDDKIALFSASALSFEEATDDLSTSVFLTGPVVGYTLSSEVVDGRTVVYATITNVENIATSRKATSYIATDDYVDQDRAWSNGQPANNSCDVGIFTADCIMHIWGDGKGAINNRKFGDFVVRGCTAKVRYGANGYPNIGVKHVAGNGTLELAQAGLAGNGTLDLVADKNVKVVITTEGASGSARDAWIGINDANTAAATIVNGDVVTSNGFVAIWRNVTLNGNLVISPWSVNSYVGGSAGDTLVINGDLVLLDGATFDFQSHNVTFGDDARLVLKGGTLINTNNIAAWPKTVIQGGVYAYGSVPGASEHTLAGGKLNVVPASDTSGATMTLTGFVLADGVSADDVIQMAGTNFKWRYNVDETTITAEAYEAIDSTVPNYWVGGAQGYWNVAANWSRGIPSAAQTILFENEALVYLDANKTVSNIVANARVTFRTTNTGSVHPSVNFNEINGMGTLALYHCGLIANGMPGTISADTTVEIQYINDNTDSWLEGRKSNGSPLKLYGKLTGSGYVIFRNDCHFYGDNSGFEGLVGMEWSDADAAFDKVFMTPESGFPGARRMNAKGKIGIGFKSGEISFGALKLYGVGAHHAINVVDGADVTINVGVGDYDVSIGDTIRFNSCTKSDMTGDFKEGAPNATLRKVGTGTMTCGLVSDANVEVAAGACALASGDEKVNVTVREGATLYATADVTVGNVVLDAGSSVRLATLELESVPLITATSATVSDATITLGEGIANTLSTQTDPASYTLLSATTLTGKPSGTVVATCEETGFGWYARASGGSLILKRRIPVSGFYMMVK